MRKYFKYNICASCKGLELVDSEKITKFALRRRFPRMLNTVHVPNGSMRPLQLGLDLRHLNTFLPLRYSCSVS